MAVNFPALKAEIVGDPLARGYAAMTSDQIVASLQGVDRSRARKIVPAYEVFEALDPGEVAALSAAQRSTLFGILGMVNVNVRGANTRAALGGMFGAGSASRTAFKAVQTELVSRAEELGLGEVKPGHVEYVRAN